MSDFTEENQCLLNDNQQDLHDRADEDGEILSESNCAYQLDPQHTEDQQSETSAHGQSDQLIASKEHSCVPNNGNIDLTLGSNDINHSSNDKQHGNSDINHGNSDKNHSNSDINHGNSNINHGNSDKQHGNSDINHSNSDQNNSNNDPNHSNNDPNHSNNDQNHSNNDTNHGNSDINSDNTCVNGDNDSINDMANLSTDKVVVVGCIQTTDVEQSIDCSTSHHTEIKVYSRRWYILIVFTLVGFTQGALIDVYQVTAQSAEAAFHWSDATTSLMQNWIYLTYVIGVGPFSWLIDTKGMRISIIVCAGLTFIGTVFRCLSTTPPLVTWFANLGNIFVGLGGPVAFTAGPVVSSMWFPPEQRTTATAIGTISGFLGPCATFVIGPYFVDVPTPCNDTAIRCHESQCSNHTGYSNIDLIKKQMLYLRYGECAVCLLVLILCLVHFPSKPPHPPSRSAALEKVSFFSGIKHLFRKDNGNFWLVCLVYMLTTGLYDVWSSLFDVNLKTFHIAEDEAGLIGALSMFTGSVSAILIGRASDLLNGYMKVTSVVLVAACCLASYWFLLVCQFIRPFSSVQLYVSAILQGLFINGPIPLFYEMAVESNYPINETVTSGMMSLLYNIFPLIFLAIFWIPNIGTEWMNWFMYACVLLAFPLILLFKERFNRLKVDKGKIH